MKWVEIVTLKDVTQQDGSDDVTPLASWIIVLGYVDHGGRGHDHIGGDLRIGDKENLHCSYCKWDGHILKIIVILFMSFLPKFPMWLNNQPEDIEYKVFL